MTALTDAYAWQAEGPLPWDLVGSTVLVLLSEALVALGCRKPAAAPAFPERLAFQALCEQSLLLASCFDREA